MKHSQVDLFIKFNPYKLETLIKLNGKELKLSDLGEALGRNIVEEARLQEWVEDLPQVLKDKYKVNSVNVTFHGTKPDYEDLLFAFEGSSIKPVFKHIPAKETYDKEELIGQIFEEIKNGPFESLHDKEMVDAFQSAENDAFEVCVVATMSAGKSTLINAMLGAKLMPSKAEACTAIITEIKDNDDASAWRALVFDKNGNKIIEDNSIDYEKMKELNGDDNVSVIKIEGEIPFVEADDVSLVLIDTPGPNNKRDPQHKARQKEFLDRKSKSLILFVIEPAFGGTDEDALLDRVARSMSVGGKQSKDRFIFVINKMDGRDIKNDGPTEGTLDRVRAYLEKHKIMSPNLFPVSALPALNLRLIANGDEIDEDDEDETEMIAGKLIRNDSMHFEKFAPLPLSKKDEIQAKLSEAIEADDTEAQALIHTGVVSVEAAIRQYVQKYAKTAKIKTLVDVFTHKLDDAGYMEEVMQRVADDKKESARIVGIIDGIQKNIDDGNSAKKFKSAVDTAVADVKDKTTKVIDSIKVKFESRVSSEIRKFHGGDVRSDLVEEKIRSLKRVAGEIEQDFKEELDDLIQKNLIDTGKALLNEYSRKLASLGNGENQLSGFGFNPLKLMTGNVSLDNGSIRNMMRVKKEECGKKWVKNEDKHWWNPFTWFDDDGHYEKIYKNVSYVNASELADAFIAPIKEGIYNNADSAREQACEQSDMIASKFNDEFKRLDKILKDKLTDLKRFAKEEKKAAECVRESQRKLDWLKDIRERVDSILEI